MENVGFNLKEYRIEKVHRLMKSKNEIEASLTALTCGLGALTVGTVIKNTFAFIENLPMQIVIYSATGAVMLGFASLCYSAGSRYYSQLQNLLETSGLKPQADSILETAKKIAKNKSTEAELEIDFGKATNKLNDKTTGLVC